MNRRRAALSNASALDPNAWGGVGHRKLFTSDLCASEFLLVKELKLALETKGNLE
jgi:hypothetical protein